MLKEKKFCAKDEEISHEKRQIGPAVTSENGGLEGDQGAHGAKPRLGETAMKNSALWQLSGSLTPPRIYRGRGVSGVRERNIYIIAGAVGETWKARVLVKNETSAGRISGGFGTCFVRFERTARSLILHGKAVRSIKYQQLKPMKWRSDWRG